MKELLNIYTDVANVDATPFTGFEFTVKGNSVLKRGTRVLFSACLQVVGGGSAEVDTYGSLLGSSVILLPGDNYIQAESVLDNDGNIRSITTVINTTSSQSIYAAQGPGPLDIDTDQKIVITDTTGSPAAGDVVLKFASVYLLESY